MVIGNGMLAKAFSNFKTEDEVIIFASGVSNSKETNPSSFEREKSLLENCITKFPDKKTVYFSTGSIYDTELFQSRYVQHKLEMERIIRGQCKKHVIFRLTNPIGFTGNNNTILNFLVHQIEQQQQFSVWKNAERNLMDIDDVVLICNHIIVNHNNLTIDIANPENYKVLDIITAIELHSNKKAICILEDKGGKPEVGNSTPLETYKKLGITFGPNYLENLLKKYF